MLTQELSRLKGAPSTCVCSVGHRNEKAIMGDVMRARHERKPDTMKSSKILGLFRVHMLDQTQSHGRARHRCEGIGKLLVGHDRGETRQDRAET